MSNNFLKPNWPAPSNVKSLITLRGFGDIFNKESQERLIKEKGLPNNPLWLTQVHGNKVIDVSCYDTLEADASFSAMPNKVCVVKTADCLPVLFCNKSGDKVAAAHAGWRGLASGVLENTLAKFNDPNEDILVYLGPAIGPKSFEVGIEVFDAFSKDNMDSNCFVRKEKNNENKDEKKWLANLYQLATNRLNRIGVTNIYCDNHCTVLENDLFYSYRKDTDNHGRMASLIWFS